MQTIQNHPFDLILARDAKWPLVCRDGQPYRALCFDAKADKPIVGLCRHRDGSDFLQCNLFDGQCNDQTERAGDLLLSADYSDPAVRAAVRLSHEKFGMKVCVLRNGRWQELSGNSGMRQGEFPSWEWEDYQYRLEQHVPAPVDPIAPKVRPWNFENAPTSLKLRSKVDGSFARCSLCTDGFIVFTTLAELSSDVTFQWLCDNYIQLDGTPCGVTE